MFELMVETRFSAAHKLVGYPGVCANLHGHTYKVQVFVTGEQLDNLGMVIDFVEVRHLLDGILEELDHKYLNELSVFEAQNPTSEKVAKFVFQRLKEGLVGKPVKVKRVAIWENPQVYLAYQED